MKSTGVFGGRVVAYVGGEARPLCLEPYSFESFSPKRVGDEAVIHSMGRRHKVVLLRGLNPRELFLCKVH